MLHLSLNGNWKLKRNTDNNWINTKVPGSVYETLLDQKLIEDPFYRDNEENAKEIADHDYEYKRTFIVNEELLLCDKVSLCCKGLDTLCDIFINNHKVAYCDNMHRIYEIDIKENLKKGENEIYIIFYSSVKYINVKQNKLRLWGVGESMDGYPHIRKPHYMFGWDWGPQIPDIGIWRDISIKGYQSGKIDDVYVTQHHENGKVQLDIRVRHINFSDRQLTLKQELISPANNTIEKITELKSYETTEKIEIDNPLLWWPNGYGNQPLYKVKVSLLDGEKVIDENDFNIGLRTLTVKRESDEWGVSFAFEINGISIFAMGANYIPEDNLLPRCSREKTKKLLSDCIRANYNCIRVWGGGIYPEDYFYDLCDEFGLIVWQDLMFACAAYEMTDEFAKNIKQEVIDNVRRIRHHASLGLWCGNNEMEEGWVNWNFNMPPKIRTDYIKQFEVLFPEIMKEYDPNTFYWSSSPSSGGSFDVPNDKNRGDVHYWDVWHGQKPFTEYRKYHFRFASEFGFQSFPCMKTVESYTESEDRNIFSYVMERHQKNPSANGKILYYLSDTFQYPKDFDSLLYTSQILQAEAIKYGVEFWRQNRGRCMGSIYWQLNDCWPVASWSSIDYYGRWKALHYFAKAFYAPVLLCAKEQDTSAELYLCNESRNEISGILEWRLCRNTGEILSSGKKDVKVSPLSSLLCESLNFSDTLKEKALTRECYLEYDFVVDGAMKSQGSVLFTKPKYFKFIKPEITYDIKETADAFQIILHANAFAKYVEVDFDVIDAIANDNYFDLSPNKEKIITIKKEDISQSVGQSQFVSYLKIRSIFDIS